MVTYSSIEAASQIEKYLGRGRFDLAIVVGSGWQNPSSSFGEMLGQVDASKISGFHPVEVAGHSGLISGYVLPSGKRALVIGARTHIYQGHGAKAVVHPIRTAAACGAKVVVLTNGAGGLKEEWTPGQAVLISDHINLTAQSPLEGAKFIDLTDLYSRRLRDLARNIEPTLDEGVYVQFRGPNYETPAEVQMAKLIGGHIVGMSTALEAIAAREAGMEVLGLSLITNLAAGISPHPLSHEEVISSGKAAGPVISELLANIAQSL